MSQYVNIWKDQFEVDTSGDWVIYDSSMTEFAVQRNNCPQGDNANDLCLGMFGNQQLTNYVQRETDIRNYAALQFSVRLNGDGLGL